MNGHRPVFWTQGLFLHPQHFQAEDDELQRQIAPFRLYGLPYFWGVRRLAWRGSASGGALEIERLEAVFPSGAVINAPYDASLPPLALSSEWPLPDRPGTLYLGLALPNAAGNNAAPAGANSGTRFTYSEPPEPMPDLYGTAPPVPVQRLAYAPVLIRDVDLERYPNFERFPIALARRVGERIELDPHFIPPLLCLDASARLAGLVQEVQDMALSCAGRLAGYKSTEGSESANLPFIINFTALGILNRNIPVLAHLRSGPNTHPWHVHGALCQFAGELSTFFEDIDCLGRTAAAEGFAGYAHANPRECFEPLCALLRKLLGNLGLGASKTLALQPDPPCFTAEIPENFLSPACKYWLSIRCDALTETMAENFPRFSKLGTPERLNTLIAKAVSGVPLTRLRSAPPGFIKKPDTSWYAIDAAHPLWQNIVERSTISLFWENAPEGVTAQLVATGR